jgi:hypothetical protein
MALRRCVVLASALAVATSLLATGCRKGAPANGTKDGGSRTDASDDASASAMLDAAVALPAATAATAAPTTTATATELAAQQPPPSPFSGTYRCFGGMKLDQAGRIVTSTIHKGTTDTVIACTASPDKCTGTVREIVNVRGKPPKVNHVKPVTLTLTRNGDVVYVVGSAEKKAGKGEQTFCPRR